MTKTTKADPWAPNGTLPAHDVNGNAVGLVEFAD